MINLLPPEVKESIRFGRLNVTLVQYAILIVAISLSLVAVLWFGLSVVGADEQSLESNIDEKQQIFNELEPSLLEAKELEKTIDTIAALLGREVVFSDLIQQIAAIIPSNATLTGLSLTGDETDPLRIEAVTSTQEVGAILRENLEESDLFEGADIQSITAGERDDNDNPQNYRISIVVNFEKGGN